HGIQDPLRSTFRADPDTEAAEFGQRIRHAGVQTIGARYALEGDPKPASLHLGGIFEDPAMVDREHVVSHPEHFGRVAAHDPLDFIRYAARRPAAMRLTECRMAAPRAMVGASTGRDDRDRALAVMLAPDFQIPLDLDPLPVRPGLRIEIGDQRPR